MSFANRLYSIVPSFGVPLLNDTLFLNQNIALSTASQQTNTIPSSGSFSPTISRGWVRVKVYAGTGTAPTLTDLVITATDGTTTVQIGQVHASVAIALSTTSGFDQLFPFETDLNLTSLTVKSTLGVPGGASMDVEVSGVV